MKHLVGHLKDDWGTKVEIKASVVEEKVIVTPFTINRGTNGKPYIGYTGKTRKIDSSLVSYIHEEEIE